MNKSIIYWGNIAGIFLVAVYLRWWKFFELTMFGHDTSRDVIITYKLYRFKEIIYHGPVFSVIWGYLSPLYYYVLFPVHYILEFHPISSSVLMNIVSLLTMAAAMYVAYRFWGSSVSLVTGLVFALSFASARTAGSGLNPSLMPVLAIGFFYYLYKFIRSERNSLWRAILFLSLLLNFHPSGVFFIPVLIILWILYRPTFTRGEILISGYIFAVFAIAPYLIMEKKMAWYTVKKVLEFILENNKSSASLLTGIPNFVDATLRNTSIMLFGDIVKNYAVWASPIYVFLIYDIRNIFSKLRKEIITADSLLALVLILYLFIFAVLVPFEKDSLNRLWYSACFIPLLTIYFSLKLFKLFQKRYIYIGYVILVTYVLFNINQFYNMKGMSDSYTHREEIARFVRNDSKGADFDIYGSNAEPINYIVWYKERDIELKEKYFKWVNWTKKKNSNLAYMIVNPEVENPDFKSVGAFKTQEKAYTTSLGYKVIRIVK